MSEKVSGHKFKPGDASYGWQNQCSVTVFTCSSVDHPADCPGGVACPMLGPDCRDASDCGWPEEDHVDIGGRVLVPHIYDEEADAWVPQPDVRG